MPDKDYLCSTMKESKDYLAGRKAGVNQICEFIEVNMVDMMQDNRPMFDILLDVVDFLKNIRKMKETRIDYDSKGFTLYFDDKVTEDKILALLDRLYVAGKPEDTHHNLATMIEVLTDDIE